MGSRARRITRTFRSMFVGVLVLALTLPAGLARAAQPVHGAGAQGGPPIEVMTRNLYLGAELGPIFAATSPEQLLAATTATWAQVLATNFPERAEALADEVAEHRPHLIGLQEVSLWRTSEIPGLPAEDVAFDFLEILLDALAARGLNYEAVSEVENFDGQLPALGGPFGVFEIRLTDRDMILARSDLPPAQLTILDEQSGVFNAALELPVLGQPLRIDRGWNAVDVRFRNQTFRFVNSHFEAFDPGEVIRNAQAHELLSGPLDTDLPVILVGDFNSNAVGGIAYGTLIGGGFTDAWNVANPGDPGLTCCQAADLLNEVSQLTTRIDLILVRGGIRVRDATLIGADPADRTPSGLWPSDHAGVAARLMLLAR
jgi:hypothetical protein